MEVGAGLSPCVVAVMTSHPQFDTDEPLWTWRVDSGDGTRDADGVTNMPAVARERLLDALRHTGSRDGDHPSSVAGHHVAPLPGYVHGVTVMTAKRHATGQITMRAQL
jgi:hypothetical protein